MLPWCTLHCGQLLSPVAALRGWLLQQIVKLSMAIEAECDTLLVIDSDAWLIRPVAESTFASCAAVPLLP
jgi:hypothetical protein